MFSLLKRMFSRLLSTESDADRAARRFHKHRQLLRTQFLQMATTSGRPKGLRWSRCEWLSECVLARDSEPGQFSLFTGVNVWFEAIEGGDMEGVEAVSMVRDGCAVFHYRNGRWGSGGRVLFNMSPLRAAEAMSECTPIVLPDNAGEQCS